jgi:DNA-binding MarR family transcriptional regulator
MSPALDHLDEVLARVHQARQRPAWRRRLFEGQTAVTSLSTLRALRAVERGDASGAGASVGDVADYMVIEHSTASRLVGRLVESGLLAKTNSPLDQRRCVLNLTEVGRKALDDVTDRRRQMVADSVAGWSVRDVDTLLTLLDRLADDFERGGSA